MNLRYILPILAVLGGGGGVGGFVGAQAQQERMASDVEEIKADVKAINRQISNSGERASLVERDVADLRNDFEELKADVKKLTERRR